MQTPPEGYRPDEGPAQGLKEIQGFRSLSPDNEYAEFFPGLLRLRRNVVVLRKHYTAASACVPSRACILTGQYSCTTGVNHTDGLFKSPEDVPWLDPKGIPTVGYRFRAAGYTTHYFGKWHVSEPEAPDYLEPWGFSNWEDSIPEAHGGNAYNSGTFRDIQFADKVAEFLDKKTMDICRYLVDLQIRKILAALDSSGLSDNTIIIFLSDHGDMTGAHGGMIQKWHVAYEEAIRVPRIVSSPLVNRNRRRMRKSTSPPAPSISLRRYWPWRGSRKSGCAAIWKPFTAGR